MWDLTIHPLLVVTPSGVYPLWDSTSSLAHRPMSGSDTTSKYYSLWAYPFELSLKNFNTHLLGRGFHTLIKMFRSPLQLRWDLTQAFMNNHVIVSSKPIGEQFVLPFHFIII